MIVSDELSGAVEHVARQEEPVVLSFHSALVDARHGRRDIARADAHVIDHVADARPLSTTEDDAIVQFFGDVLSVFMDADDVLEVEFQSSGSRIGSDPRDGQLVGERTAFLQNEQRALEIEGSSLLAEDRHRRSEQVFWALEAEFSSLSDDGLQLVGLLQGSIGGCHDRFKL